MADERIINARRMANDALRHCLNGGGEEGLAMYRSLATPDDFAELPIGLHVHLIEEAGEAATAATLRQMAVRHGGDLSWKAALGKATPDEGVAEYERLFAAGLGNAVMVDRYVRLTSQLGYEDKVATMFDVGRLLHVANIGAEPGVAAALIEEGGRMGAVGAKDSIRQSCVIPSLVRRGGEMAELLARCSDATAAYLARWAASDHPLAASLPADFALGAWGLVSQGQGYNTRHVHPTGWITGVYYPMGLSDDMRGGSLRIGTWGHVDRAGWPNATIRPEAGMLVLMPCFYVHWTEPLGAPGLRVAVAFDAVPDGWAEAHTLGHARSAFQRES